MEYAPAAMPRDAQNTTNLPKDTVRHASATSPPPAYTPRTQLAPRSLAQHLHRAAAAAAAAAAAHSQAARDSPLLMNRPPLSIALADADNDDDSDAAEGLSSISLRINTAVSVAKNNNLVCLADTPASHAAAIANAVVKAIQENSSGQCGIPMIDEDGRPRPIKIEVDAGVTVDGAGNVVGNEAIISRVLSERSLLRKRDGDGDNDEDAGMAGMPSKRRRSGGSSSSSSSPMRH